MGSKLAQKWVKENRMPLGAQKAGLFGAAGAASGGGQIGLFMTGDEASGDDKTIDYVTISSAGNATNFGNDVDTRYKGAGTDNGTDARGINAGGYDSGGATNVISYVTITSAGNAADFGDLSTNKGDNPGACSNGTNDRGVVGGAGGDGSIDYVTITSTGNASDFGDFGATSTQRISGTSNGTDERGVFWGGFRDATSTNNIDYITINSTGNASDFGDLSLGRSWTSACSNDTDDRGICYSGNGTNRIDYITITSTGNATDFGNSVINSGEGARGGTDSGTDNIGVFGGGNDTSGDEIDTITISSTGDASDFGNLTVGRYAVNACANSKA